MKTKSNLVYDDLKESIQNGRYKVGAGLPNEIDFSKQLGVARITLRTALKKLESEKLIVRYKNRGTFVHKKSYKDKTISVVIPRASYVDKSSTHSWFVDQYVLEGVCAQATEAGMNMGIQFLHPDEQPLNESVEILLKTNAAGYVFPALGGNVEIIVDEHEEWPDFEHLKWPGNGHLLPSAQNIGRLPDNRQSET